MELTFLQAKVGRLSKTVRPDAIEPYPLAAQFRSHSTTAHTLDDFAAALRAHANRGHCLHVGNLLAELTSWGKRASLADRNSDTQWLVLDIDGLHVTNHISTPVSADDFSELADYVVTQLNIPELYDVSFIAQASTKLGLNPGIVSMHLFYMLDAPIAPGLIKSWLKHANLSNPTLATQIRLTASSHALSFPLDISCADPGRLIYIAPPVFHGVTDPFADPDDRITVVRKDKESIKTSDLRDIEPSDRLEKRLKAQLREAAGYNPREAARIKRVTINGETVELLMNPAPGLLKPAFTQRGFCYYNLNTGDSNAYYHPEFRPDVIYNFKGEPAFRWADVDKHGYDAYRKQYAEQIAKTDPVNTFVVINQHDDAVYKVWHDHENRRVTCVRSDRNQVEDFYTEYGKLVPDYLPTWNIEYNPPADYQVDYTGQSINTFSPSDVMRDGIVTVAGEPLNLDSPGAIARVCPAIWFTLDHVTGNDRESLARFINWIAFILQQRRKTETAWVFQGVEGTGKGTLYDEILSPLLGKPNVTMKQTLALNDQFDAWRKDKLLVCFDEFQVSNDKAGQALISRLRNWITEERASIRAMRREGYDTALFENYIFFSNMHNMLPLPDTDRRYNICPRQDRRLKDVCDTYELYSAIRNEIKAFGSLLHCWEVNNAAAQTCMNNAAKQIARDASRTMAEEFAHAIKTNNLDYFLQLTETLHDTVSADQILNMDRARRTVSELVRSRIAPTCIATADLANLYNTLHSQNMGVAAFSKMMARFGLHAERFLQGQTRLRGITVQLSNSTLDESELNALAPSLRTLQAIA